ncbi:hypothetical protein EGW08_017260 [Elysia chlorotica]|uniref:Calponin-homology (CH) domain-containing protein n=1 Tax=Elysia chlorotica TaxID=188477 RepID=A0A3S1AXQ8_ELYCH|nr:hypothetical protein EGW08_017260 [Elysia chlorotica]
MDYDRTIGMDSTTIKYKKGKDEREDIQKKTFTKWINSQLSKFLNKCLEQDGQQLLALLEVLSGLRLWRRAISLFAGDMGRLHNL